MQIVGVAIIFLKVAIQIVCTGVLIWAAGAEAMTFAALGLIVPAGVLWLMTRHAKRMSDGY